MANGSCYEAQNTASRIINGARDRLECQVTLREVNEREARRSEAATDASVPTIKALYLRWCYERRGARADVFQAVTSADCARQERSTPAGDAVNWFVLANRHDAERSIVNWFTPRDLQ